MAKYKKPRTKEEVLKDLQNLVSTQGYIYSLVLIIIKDQFYPLDSIKEINWKKAISFQEISLLTGYLVKQPISLEAADEETTFNAVEKTIALLEELQLAHNTPFIDELVKNIDQVQTEKKDPDEVFREVFSKGELLVEPIFYSDSGAYDFQYWSLGPLLYKRDAQWLLDKHNFESVKAADFAKGVKQLLEKKHNSFRPEQENFEAFCRAILDTLCFNPDELAVDVAVSASMLSLFTVTPEKGVNSAFLLPGEFNIVDAKPIILLSNGRYFCPISFSLSRATYESPYYWMTGTNYEDLAFTNRGLAANELTYKMLVEAFGSNRVYKNVRVIEGKTEKTDIDCLVLLGNKAVVFQVKSKKLTLLARTGNNEKLQTDFTAAIQEAYGQGLVSKRAITTRSSRFIKEDGDEITLSEQINDAYVVCVTADHYPAIAHQLKIFLDKPAQEDYPIAISIFDLELLTFYLSDPFEFLYYIRQRIRLTDYFEAANEIAFLAFHLLHKLFKRPGSDKVALDDSFGVEIDQHFIKERGGYRVETNEAPRTKWKNEQFDQLIEQIKSSGDPGFTDAIFLLYDIAGEGADELIQHMNRLKERATTEGRSHDFSALYDHGNVGITYFATVKDMPEDWLLNYAAARKYKARASEWLVLHSVVDSQRIVDTVAYNGEMWEENKNLQKLVDVMIKPGTLRRPEKVGRNDPCPCGSHRKYKKCCGR